LVLSALINWDVLILNYNLKHRDTVPVDVEFLLEMHPSVMPILEANSAALSSIRPPLQRNDVATPGSNWVSQYLDQEKQQFLATDAQYSWLSWNLADQQLRQYLHTKTPE